MKTHLLLWTMCLLFILGPNVSSAQSPTDSSTFQYSIYKYLEYRIQDAPQIFISVSPLGVWSVSGDAGFGPLFGINYRPIKQFDLSGNVIVPFFHVHGKSFLSDPNKKRFFAADVYATVYFFTKSKMKHGRFKFKRKREYPVKINMPKNRNHQFGFRPGYLYGQGNYQGLDYPYVFNSQIVTGGFIYRRITHHVIDIPNYGYRLYSKQLDFFADFMYGAVLNAYRINVGYENTTSGIENRLGGKAGFEYRTHLTSLLPIYMKLKAEGGYAPSFTHHFYMQFGLSFGLGVDKFYRNKYKDIRI